MNMIEEIDRLARLCEAKDAELSEAQAQIAMQVEFVNRLHETYPLSVDDCVHCEKIQSSTSETVAAWRAKETEPYKREVEMLRGRLMDYMTAAPEMRDYDDEKAILDTQATALAYEREVENRGAVKALEDAEKIADEHYRKMVKAGENNDAESQGRDRCYARARTAEYIRDEIIRKKLELRAANKGE